jgi:hypothetical protein
LASLDPASDEYAETLSLLIQGYRDRIDKAFVDEILIEATVTSLTLQHRDELDVRAEDYFRTMNASEFFMERYGTHLKKVETELVSLLAKNRKFPSNKMPLKRALAYLEEQHENIFAISDEATTNASQLISP